MGLPITVRPAPPGTAAVSPRWSGRVTLLAGLVGLLGVLCALALPFAPVLSERATVTWPAAGADPASTTAFFVPYTPAELHVRIPCSAVRAAAAGTGPVTVLATVPDKHIRTLPGLAVVADQGRVRVSVAGRQVADAAAGAQCGVRVDADRVSTTVVVGGAGAQRVDRAPEVHAFVTDLPPEQARGMAVTARAISWFEARPTGVKLVLIAAQLALAAASVVLLYGAGRRLAAGRAEPRDVPKKGRLLRWGIDASVVGALGLWLFIGPITADDGYAMMTIRNSGASNDISNYLRWYNASEAPFTLWQWVIKPFSLVSLAPVWLRLPSILVGVATWFIVRRGLVGRLLPEYADRAWLRALTAVAFLAAWLPYGMGIRPEPLVAFGLSATFACLLWGTSPGARAGGLPQLGLAALLAGLSLSVTPSGILVFAPVLVMLPRVVRTLTAGLPEHRRDRVLTVVSRVALLAAPAAVGLTAMFAMQSLHGASVATQIHDQVGPSYSWYQESVRYDLLLAEGPQGSATRRVFVLVCLGLVMTMAVLLARGVRGLPGLREAHLATAVAAGGFGLLWLTPSKWSHHFGALAGLGAAFVAVAMVTIGAAARREGDRAVLAAGLAGGGVVAVGTALAFSGPNTWYLHSAYGMPGADKPVEPFGLPLPSPLFWAGLVGLLAVIVLIRRRGLAAARSDLTRLGAAAPAIIAAAALAATVAVLLVGFTAAPFRAGEAYTMAGQNLASATGGDTCGLPDKILVQASLPEGVLRPVEGTGRPSRSRGFASGGHPVGTPPDSTFGQSSWVWGSHLAAGPAAGAKATGELVTPWFGLPPRGRASRLVLSVAGRAGGANSLSVEFRKAGAAERPVSHRLAVGDRPWWRPVVVPPSAVPAGADQVRIRAVDRDPTGWLAVAGPRITRQMTLTDFLARVPGPALPSTRNGFQSPCVRDMPVVAHGVAQAPAVVLADRGPVLVSGGFERRSGVFYGVQAAGSATVVPSRLVGLPRYYWGRVVLVDYHMARDAYQLSLTTERTSGWRGDEAPPR